MCVVASCASKRPTPAAGDALRIARHRVRRAQLHYARVAAQASKSRAAKRKKGDPRRAARMARLGYLHERREFRPLRNRTFGVEFRGNVGAADQVHVGLCGLEAVVQITTWFLACADDDIVHLQ